MPKINADPQNSKNPKPTTFNTAQILISPNSKLPKFKTLQIQNSQIKNSPNQKLPKSKTTKSKTSKSKTLKFNPPKSKIPQIQNSPNPKPRKPFWLHPLILFRICLN